MERDRATQHETAGPPEDLPLAWKSLSRLRWRRQTNGRSEASVFRLERDVGPPLFVKTEVAGPFTELPGEIIRLRWLAERGVATPRVIESIFENEQDWLLMSAVQGRALSASGLEPVKVAEIAAKALHDLHRLDPATCPFNHASTHRIAQAWARANAGMVDEADFDESHSGCSAAELFDKLQRCAPPVEEGVVTHGDATLSNLLADDGDFSGFVDCGRVGIADPHQDLALLARSIRGILGTEMGGRVPRSLHVAC